jgi:hypothetical protein
MPISFISKTEDGFGVLELAGTLTLGPSLRDLRENVRKVLTDTKLTGLIVMWRRSRRSIARASEN